MHGGLGAIYAILYSNSALRSLQEAAGIPILSDQLTFLSSI